MTTVTINLRELAVEIDTILASLYEAQHYHQQRAVWARDAIHRAAKDKRTGYDLFGNATWEHTTAHCIGVLKDEIAEGKTWLQRELDEYDHQQALLYQIKVERDEANEVYAEHLWNRAFLVTNSNGHVHNGMDCTTCFPTTRYEWLVAYSAAEEDEIVKAAGELACTVCYPSAPSDYLNRPAELISKTRQEKDAAAAERAAAKVEREAKRLAKAATKSGDDLFIPNDWEATRRPERISTEATARKVWNSDQDNLTSTYVPEYDWAGEEREAKQAEWKVRADWRKDRQRERQSIIEAALAEKHGITPEQVREDLLKRYAKRRPR